MIVSLIAFTLLLHLTHAVGIPNGVAEPAIPTAVIQAPYPLQSGIATDCNRYHRVREGDNCQSIAKNYSITLDDFYRWNPSVGRACETLWLGYYVCTGASKDSPPSTPITSPSTPTQTAPTPTQYGLTPACTQFYQAQTADTCISIVTQKYPKITLSQFMGWNPGVGTTCQSLLAGYYYCVSVQPQPGDGDSGKM